MICHTIISDSPSTWTLVMLVKVIVCLVVFTQFETSLGSYEQIWWDTSLSLYSTYSSHVLPLFCISPGEENSFKLAVHFEIHQYKSLCEKHRPKMSLENLPSLETDTYYFTPFKEKVRVGHEKRFYVDV